eukprot:CAMPEP_0179414812 /NCGR_PEP_ID=MMETSP0799-20121207/5887_1 /TAXON_ID=46947 /ORGANISM="Geminigera cryophila, Strain CCMP2564" /LENGTH=305 /DNA_ID=CAMNT_0021187487 /DNA_START=28 /DNA_END=945 /DNA_ORIENTATION=+
MSRLQSKSRVETGCSAARRREGRRSEGRCYIATQSRVTIGGTRSEIAHKSLMPLQFFLLSVVLFDKGCNALPRRCSAVHGCAVRHSVLALHPAGMLRVRGGGLERSEKSERSEVAEVNGVLVSFCESEPAPARAIKYVDKVWGVALCFALVGVLLLRGTGGRSAAWLEDTIAPWLRDELALDLYLAVGVTVMFGIGSAIFQRQGLAQALQVKKRAWLVSVFAAGICFVAGVVSMNAPPLNWDIRMRPELLTETNLSRVLVHFFRVQAVLDLVLGLFFYRCAATCPKADKAGAQQRGALRQSCHVH